MSQFRVSIDDDKIKLTARQRAILVLVNGNVALDEIARRLGISRSMVDRNLAKARAKIDRRTS